MLQQNQFGTTLYSYQNSKISRLSHAFAQLLQQKNPTLCGLPSMSQEQSYKCLISLITDGIVSQISKKKKIKKISTPSKHNIQKQKELEVRASISLSHLHTGEAIV